MAGARVPNDTMVGKESAMENGRILQHFRGFYHDCYRLNIRSQKASKAPGIYNFLSTAWTPDMEDTMSVKGVTQSAVKQRPQRKEGQGEGGKRSGTHRREGTGSQKGSFCLRNNPLFEKRPETDIGQDIQIKRDLRCFIKCSPSVRLQWQRIILYKRLKVLLPLTSSGQQTATQLLKLAHKDRPETKQEKKLKLLARAEKKAVSKGDGPTLRPPLLQAGVSTVTTLMKNEKAHLVVIDQDVDRIELVVFLPTLCWKMGVFYCIIKGKARLGRLVHRKTYAAVAFTQVNPEDMDALAKQKLLGPMTVTDMISCCHWGDNILGLKSVARIVKLEKAKAKELATKLRRDNGSDLIFLVSCHPTRFCSRALADKELKDSEPCSSDKHGIAEWMAKTLARCQDRQIDYQELGLHDRSGSPTGHCPSLPIVRDREHGPCLLNASLKRQRPFRSHKCHYFEAMQVTGATTWSPEQLSE
ncbi:LOW QUALITY PROTEIN: hypothetical protein U0070_011420 [Myodes glareolus]|uniref:Large ribosomal subunit protein eL8 n=1 Tax=Myodes glareolus TaxID=447135 RepID=A0AAW0HYN2_MYOGA